jgi:hypothetical protein
MENKIDITRKMLSNSKKMKQDRMIKYIITVVGMYLDIDEFYVVTNNRKREYIYARQMAIYLILKYSTATLDRTGEIFNGKNHATVLHAKRQMMNLIETDKLISKQVKEVENIIELNAAAIVSNVDLNIDYYYINFNNFQSIKINHNKAMMLTGFSEDEIEQIQLLLNGIVETRTHENTGLYILEEKANVDDSRNKPSIDN